MGSVQVLIIILNWNGWADTKQCLNSLKAIKNIDFSTVIVDNGSINDTKYIKDYGLKNYSIYYEFTKEKIKQSTALPFPKPKSLILIKNNENLGFAKANNIGIKFGSLSGYEYIYLLNNDTVVEPDSLYNLLQVLHNSNYAAVVPQIRYYKPNDVIWCCGGELKKFYESYYYKNENIKVVPSKSLINITFATGCALLFKRSKIKQLSEKFFFGEEDVELSLRLKKNGMKMACVLNSIIYHKESASIDKSAKYLNKIYIHKLNRMINIKDYAPAYWPCIILYRSFKFFLLILLVEKRGWSKSLKYGLKFCKQAFTLSELNRETFFNILNMDLS
jgi:GT2 family glycosyltransferase